MNYNGWTNYATWRINLEIFDGFDTSSLDGVDEIEVDTDHVADQLQNYAYEIIDMTSTEGLARDYALAFLQDVNWHEIAQYMIDDYIKENQE